MNAAPASASESILVAVQRGMRRLAGRQCVGCAVGVSLLKLPATARSGCSSASVLQRDSGCMMECRSGRKRCLMSA